MEQSWINLATLLAVVIILYTYLSNNRKNHKKSKNEPPSPPGLPIIGHLHIMKQPLHQTLHHIATKYGGEKGVLLLRLGARKALIISSPSAVEECFVKNDVAFADRPHTLVGQLLQYNSTTMSFTPYNDHFRALKRFTTQEVFSSTRVPLFSGIRQEEVRLLLKELWQDAVGPASPVKVDLNRRFNELALNIMTKMVAGKRYYGRDVDSSKEAKEFSELIREGSLLHATGHPADFLPALRFLFRGLEKQMVTWMKKTDQFFQQVLDERKELINKGDTKAIIDVFIRLQQNDPKFFTNDVLKGLIFVLVIAGADTTAATMEWALSLLLNHPESMKKARQEIDLVVGHDRLINEDDVSKLPYLQNVINETLRLYPPTPMLLPHESSEDCTVCDYNVPKGTMLMVSLWTIHRDPRWWNEPEKFKPERFEGKEGETFCKLLPFGLGRRACPGYAMGKRAVGLVLGSMLQCFDWQRPSEEMIDMSQAPGLTTPKAVPLEAMCNVRPCVANLVSNEVNV